MEIASSVGKGQRTCLECGHSGEMKTWLANYFVPQFIALIGLFFMLIPGLIFIALVWGKFKCPKCGALGKNRPAKSYVDIDEHLSQKQCPFCAETIKAEAIVCRYCGRDLPVKT